MRVAGVILAGGLSRRMGGGDKALAPLAGRPLLAHVVARLAPQVDGLMLSANGDAARFAAFALPVVPDLDRRFSGPLAGILAAMTYAAQMQPAVTALVSVPADTPFVPDDLVRRLVVKQAENQAEVVMAASAGRPHPTVALWSLDLREVLAQALARDERRVLGFIEGRRHASVEWAAEPFDPFRNINTPEELAEAERLAARRP